MTHSNLWAPWRMAYIRENAGRADLPKATGCFLCGYRELPEKDMEHYVVHRSKLSIVVLNRFPYNNGHLLIAPLDHIAALSELSVAQLLDLQELIVQSTTIITREFKAQGFNVGLNLGEVAGAGLPGHLHWHVVPRWKGDANFMDVVADTHVIPDSLAEMCRLLTGKYV